MKRQVKRSFLKSFLLTAICAFGVSSSLYAEDPDTLNHRATTMYQQVLSPFCPGRSLNDCPSSKATELKDQMKARLEQGEAPEAIIEGVLAQYGEQFRAVPRFAGVGVFVWAIPLSFVVLGGLWALRVSSGRKGPSSKSKAPISSEGKLSAEVEQRLREELAKLE